MDNNKKIELANIIFNKWQTRDYIIDTTGLDEDVIDDILVKWSADLLDCYSEDDIDDVWDIVYDKKHFDMAIKNEHKDFINILSEDLSGL